VRFEEDDEKDEAFEDFDEADAIGNFTVERAVWNAGKSLS
jgi:hypothetical protein